MEIQYAFTIKNKMTSVPLTLNILNNSGSNITNDILTIPESQKLARSNAIDDSDNAME